MQLKEKPFQIRERHFLMVEEIPVGYCPVSYI